MKEIYHKKLALKNARSKIEKALNKASKPKKKKSISQRIKEIGQPKKKEET